jgi:hypothetical protein
MLGLPQSTAINKPLSKKAVFAKFKLGAGERKLFDEQISRLAIVGEISPQTVNIAAGAGVLAIYIILVTLKTAECDKRNIALLSKLIDQRLLFILQYDAYTRLAVYRAGKVLMSRSKKFDEWELNLQGLDLAAVWDNLIAEIGGIDLTGGKDLDETIIANERMERLTKQIAALRKKALHERQPRRKWKLVEEIKRLNEQMEGVMVNEKA